MFKDKSNNYKLKIAFDFDSTLDQPLFFDLAKHLIKKGHDVWIMTARIGDYEGYCKVYELREKPPRFSMDLYNMDLFQVAEQLNIPREKIIFTNYDSKKESFFEHKFDLLIDDDASWHCNEICENNGLALNI